MCRKKVPQHWHGGACYCRFISYFLYHMLSYYIEEIIGSCHYTKKCVLLSQAYSLWKLLILTVGHISLIWVHGASKLQRYIHECLWLAIYVLNWNQRLWVPVSGKSKEHIPFLGHVSAICDRWSFWNERQLCIKLFIIIENTRAPLASKFMFGLIRRIIKDDMIWDNVEPVYVLWA